MFLLIAAYPGCCRLWHTFKKSLVVIASDLIKFTQPNASLESTQYESESSYGLNLVQVHSSAASLVRSISAKAKG